MLIAANTIHTQSCRMVRRTGMPQRGEI